MSSSSKPPDPMPGDAPVEIGPTQMMLTTPPPVLHLLTRLSPTLSHLTAGINVLTWKTSLTPFTLIVVWWGLCLFGAEVVRYGLNGVLLLALGAGWIRSRAAREAPPMAATMDAVRFADTLDQARLLNAALADLELALDPFLALLTWRDPHASLSATSYLLTSYPFVLALTYYVPLSHILGTIGTVALCWNAPWFSLVRRAMTKSLIGRWAGRMILSVIGGGRGIRREIKRGRRGFALLRSTLTASSAPPSFVPQQGGRLAKASATGQHDEDMHYTFTVYENQRWWVGLDWTQALLPNERPSWSDAHHAPVSPPSSFLLPATSAQYTTIDRDPEHRLKRITEWRWIDEWHVRKASVSIDVASAAGGHQPPKSPVSDWKSRFSGRQANDTATPVPTTPDGKHHHRSQSDAVAEDDTSGSPSTTAGLPTEVEETEAEWDCDAQGWQYGDNAWTPLSSKGKIGRYTRRRAWQRTAIVVERTETVATEDVPSSAAGSVDKSTEGGSSDGLRQRKAPAKGE